MARLARIVGVVILFFILRQSHSQIMEKNQTEILRASTIIFRHGDRNPIKSYPGDPYDNESFYWPEGYGATTMRGKIRLYNLGRYMRNRYPTFNRKNVIIYSSQTNRTISSAMSNLAGFYGQNRSFLKHVDTYNPSGFGINVISKAEDDFIMLSKECPKYIKMRNEYYIKSLPMGRFQSSFDIINQHTGLNLTTAFSLDPVIFADTMLIQKSRNLKLPKWAEDLYQSGEFHEIRDAFFVSLMPPTLEMRRLFTGSMINRFLNEMDKVINETKSIGDKWASQTNFPKIIIHSGHDLTVSAWLINLDLFDWYGPPYGAAIFLEIYESTESKTDHDRFQLKVFYKNDSESEPHQLSIPACPNPCHYSDFKNHMESLSLKNWAKECQLAQMNDSRNDKPKSSETKSTAASNFKTTLEALTLSTIFVFVLNLF